MRSYVVRTLGCKANYYDSQLIEAELKRRGWVPWSKSAENAAQGPSLCIVNSCTVTDEADRQTRKIAARLFHDNPNAGVVVTGCGAEVDPERLAQSKGIHYVIGNRDKHQLVSLILKKLEERSQSSDAIQTAGELLGKTEGYNEMASRHPEDREWPLPESSFFAPAVSREAHSSKTRGFLKIQEGCNSFCTYCVIPYARGPSRSLRPGEIVRQVQQLVSGGIREIVITGTNIGDYGTDWGDQACLEELLEMMLKETDIQRLRVSSLDPTEITPRLMELMAREKRFCPHFHVSLQSPSTKILRLMKRRYGYERVRECLEQIQSIPAPLGGVYVGMDVITGFPGETDEDFRQTVGVLEALPWTRLHVFPYSERAKTPATRLPDVVSPETRQLRTRALNELSLARLRQIHDSVLQKSREQDLALDHVLIEKFSRIQQGKWAAAGYTKNYLRVLFSAEEARHLERNQIVSAKLLDRVVDSASHDAAFVGKQLI